MKSALVIYNVVSKLVVEEPAYAAVGTDILLSIIRRFNTESIVIDLTIKLIKVCLAIHFADVKSLATIRRSVTHSTNIYLDDATHKYENFAMKELIYKTIQEDIN